jgi:hypothetical protein
MRALALAAALALTACGGAAVEDAPDDCERSAYELERTRYRCTSEGELQRLDCGEWLTVQVCAEAEACSPGPAPGCDEVAQ